ncbi:MAG TPA: GNAT family N-acetyltransferase [Trichocoleus sp.]
MACLWTVWELAYSFFARQTFTVTNFPIPGYTLRVGSGLDRALLVKLMQRTYQELFPNQGFAHLSQTVDQYLSKETPLWWVEEDRETHSQENAAFPATPSPIACLWIGTAIDQIQGERNTYIFLLYVSPAHRRQGIGFALMQLVEDWAKARGDQQIGLQVFQQNQPALNLYEKLGYKSQSIWMVKQLG